MTAPGEVPEVGYSPGYWVAVAGTRLWLLADVDPAAAVVRRCWELIRRGVQVDDVISAIMSDGFRAVDSFAVLRYTQPETHVVVRGGAGAHLVTPSGDVVEIRTTGAADWVDRRFPQPFAGFRLVTGSGTDSTAPPLPLSGGVVRAAEIDIRLTAGHPDPTDGSQEPTSAVFAPATSLIRQAVLTPQPDRDVQPASLPVPTTDAHEDEKVDYDYLFGATQLPVVKPEPGPAEPTDAPPTAVTDPAVPPTAAPAPMVWQPEMVDQRAPVVETLPPIDTGLAGTVQDQGLIVDVAWALPPTAAPVLPIRPPAVSDQPAYPRDHPARVRDDAPRRPELAVVAPQVPERDDDVDMTVHRPRRRESVGEGSTGGPTVPAFRCPTGHLNPTKAEVCRVCAAPVQVQQPILVARPPLGVLRLSTGDVIPLDRGVIMGRAPDVPEGDDRDRPHVVRWPSPDNDISRRHVEVRLDGWQVLVVDLGSTNGTVVTLPDGASEQIAPHTGRVLEPGAVVSLSDDASFRYEVTG